MRRRIKAIRSCGLTARSRMSSPCAKASHKLTMPGCPLAQTTGIQGSVVRFIKLLLLHRTGNTFAVNDDPLIGGPLRLGQRECRAKQRLRVFRHEVSVPPDRDRPAAESTAETTPPLVSGRRHGHAMALCALNMKASDSGRRHQAYHRTIRSWIPQAESAVVPDSTHFMPHPAPRAVAERLAEFFSRHPMHS
jgi:hypothetical protein